tara:strand:+ start:69 stop:518 length:450 start_codon:yes stop_codon:yes gene_type:complete
MKLKELIGSKIIEVKYHYSPSNEYQLQEFYSYLLLNNGLIFSFPTYEDESNFDSIESQEYFNNKFKTGSKISNKVKPLIVGQKISNLHFPYFQDEPDDDEKAFIELENGYFISETNYGPQGVSNVDLKIITKEKFNSLIDKDTKFKPLN